MTPITRVTMIKIEEDKLDIALEGFKTFTETQSKVPDPVLRDESPSSLRNPQDGKPYILSMEAGPAGGHVKDQGFTFVTKSVFQNASDMKFYEDECPGHQEYKGFLKKHAPVTGLQMVCFEPGVSFAL